MSAEAIITSLISVSVLTVLIIMLLVNASNEVKVPESDFSVRTVLSALGNGYFLNASELNMLSELNLTREITIIDLASNDSWTAGKATGGIITFEPTLIVYSDHTSPGEVISR